MTIIFPGPPTNEEQKTDIQGLIEAKIELWRKKALVNMIYTDFFFFFLQRYKPDSHFRWKSPWSKESSLVKKADQSLDIQAVIQFFLGISNNFAWQISTKPEMQL